MAPARPDVQLALRLPVPSPPTLRERTPWERAVADYASTGMTLAVHPMALMRGEFDESMVSSAGWSAARDGARVEVAGVVVARQRRRRRAGLIFMLLEDEWARINVVVLPPTYARHRG